MSFTFGILTVSDSCSAGQKADHSGPALQRLVKEFYPESVIALLDCVPDDRAVIKERLIHWCDVKRVNVVLTTGGTGFAPRDVTPEATRDVVAKLAPAVTQHIAAMGMQVTPMAMLSRAVCGIREKTLILNLPGSKKGAVESFGFAAKTLRHAIEVMLDNKSEVVEAHNVIQGSADCRDSGIEKSKAKIGCAALRNRTSPYPMVSVPDALSIIKEHAKNFLLSRDGDNIKIEHSLGMILDEDVYSNNPLPPFPASTKDGYAVLAADGTGVRKVVEVVAAGDSPGIFTLKSGEITRISTGAPVPDGADAVVQVEDTELVRASDDNMKELEVRINVAPSVGLDIRPIGSDIPAKCKILERGDAITPAHIGVMAAMGITSIKARRRFSIGIVSTGNEIQEVGTKLAPGKIYDSNKSTLINLLKSYGFEGADCGIARDNPDIIKQKLAAAFSAHDLVITTGGVSMGEYDLIKEVLLKDFAATIHFGRVDMKPGKPTTFATCKFGDKAKMLFGLPGNPVSASVTFLVFVLPALQYRHGKLDTSTTKVILDMDLELDFRPEYMRAKLVRGESGDLLARTTGNQISSRLNSFIGADALLVLPGKTSEKSKLSKGTVVDAILLNR